MPTDRPADRLAATWLETDAAHFVASIEAAIVTAVGSLKQPRRAMVILPAAHVVDFAMPVTEIINAAGARSKVVGSVDALSQDTLATACRPGYLALFVMGAPATNVISPAAFSWLARRAHASSLMVIKQPEQASGLGATAFDLTLTCTANGLGVIGGRHDTIEHISQSAWASIAPAAPIAVEQARAWLQARADEAILGGQPPDPMSERDLRPDMIFTSHPDGTLTPAAPAQGQRPCE